MNKRSLPILSMAFSVLFAQDITLTPEQEKSWQIKVEKPLKSAYIPLGEFITEVVTPPTLLHTISLPFNANVKKLHVAKYQKVEKGQTLAEVTGTEWINVQQEAIMHLSEFKYYEQYVKRKNILCKEGVIPKKVHRCQCRTYKI